ncbi:hypothetical protein RvY_09687 [Ramazzottius varieornatus]|uniref:Uncharacterized protein n=1 Tax=Ramazzottius varieornatus TaxID=947166 RepID=A0A1D1VJ89_RAMVA|nr:hypothetical protein RvY_09687 [Ramazzottius varieornatus]
MNVSGQPWKVQTIHSHRDEQALCWSEEERGSEQSSELLLALDAVEWSLSPEE